MVSPFKSASLTAEQQLFNRPMSSVREAVEWSFGRMKTLWATVDLKKQHKVMLSPVGKVVAVAILLANYHRCHDGSNQISSFFGVTYPHWRTTCPPLYDTPNLGKTSDSRQLIPTRCNWVRARCVLWLACYLFLSTSAFKSAIVLSSSSGN